LDEDGETINSTDDEFVQPSDEDAQGNVLADEELARKMMTDVHRTPSKEDSKPAAQPENEDRFPSIQYRIQHDHFTRAISIRHQIWMALDPPQMDQQHTS
jgi:hypothetical protein